MSGWRRAACLNAAVLLLLVVPGERVSGRPSVAVPSTQAASIAELLDRYSRRDAVVGTLPPEATQNFLQQLRRSAASWVGPKESPDATRRRLLVATYVVELIDANFDVAWQPGFGADLIEWACVLLREGPPLAAERSWHLAAVALLERAHRLQPRSLSASRERSPAGAGAAGRGEEALLIHLGHADSRFPDDGQWTLARAVATELLLWPPARDEDTLSLPRATELRVVAGLRAAAGQPAVRSEAHLRWGYLELRRGNATAALSHFDAVGMPEDRVLGSWLHLFRGRTFSRMNRSAEALESYRRAVGEFPQAQSATLALAAALATSGQGIEAQELVRRMLSVDPPLDPWRVYGFPLYRHWSVFMMALTPT